MSDQYAALGATILGGPLMGWISGRWGARSGFAVAGAATGITAAVLAALARRGNEVTIDEIETAESVELAVETST